MQKFHGTCPLFWISTEPSIPVHVWHTVWSWSKCGAVTTCITSKAFCTERISLCPRCGPPLKKGKTRVFHGLHQVWTLWFCVLLGWCVKFVLMPDFTLHSLLCLYKWPALLPSSWPFQLLFCTAHVCTAFCTVLYSLPCAANGEDVNKSAAKVLYSE